MSLISDCILRDVGFIHTWHYQRRLVMGRPGYHSECRLPSRISITPKEDYLGCWNIGVSNVNSISLLTG